MKLIKKIYNFISIIMLLWTIISGSYLALPQEYKDMIPQFNWLTALISGGSTGILGATMLLVNGFMKKNKNEYDTKFLDMAKNYIDLKQDYKELENKIALSTKEAKQTNELLEKTNRLIEIDLQSKLSNPLVENYIKEKIRGEGIEQK